MYDDRIGKFFSVDPLASKYPYNSPYAFSENRVISAVEFEGLEAWDLNDGSKLYGPLSKDGLTEKNGGVPIKDYADDYSNLNLAGMPFWVLDGTAAHRAFTSYWRRFDPNERYWKADKTIGFGSLERPDLMYDNRVVGGVWEVKPAPPSVSSILAPIEAKYYAEVLNLKYNTNRFGTGTLAGAPDPFRGKLVLPLKDEVTGKLFYFFQLNLVDGAIYYTEKIPNNIPVPCPEREIKPVPIYQIQPGLQPYKYGPQGGYPGQSLEILIEMLIEKLSGKKVNVPPPIPSPVPIPINAPIPVGG